MLDCRKSTPPNQIALRARFDIIRNDVAQHVARRCSATSMPMHKFNLLDLWRHGHEVLALVQEIELELGRNKIDEEKLNAAILKLHHLMQKQFKLSSDLEEKPYNDDIPF